MLEYCVGGYVDIVSEYCYLLYPGNICPDNEAEGKCYIE